MKVEGGDGSYTSLAAMSVFLIGLGISLYLTQML